MAAAYPDAALPTAAPDLHAAARRRPRNYLSAGEYRKLFWAFMPPALVVIVAAELLLRPLWEPPPPPRERQVDTRLEAVTGPPPGEDAVVILPDDEPPETRDENLLGASLAALTRIRDATFFGQGDRDAWLEMGLALTGYEGRTLPPPQDVGFTELFGQPRSFRGRAVRIKGTLHRLERLGAVANDYGIDHYWQGWLEPAGGPASPVVVHFMNLPEGMATGLEIVEPVVVSGFFLKNMAYRAADGVRLAPLVLALEPVPPPPVSEAGGGGLWDRSLTALGVATMLAIVTAIGIGFLVAGRGRRQRVDTTGLDSALADVEPFSIGAALEQVAAEERAGGDEAAGGADA